MSRAPTLCALVAASLAACGPAEAPPRFEPPSAPPPPHATSTATPTPPLSNLNDAPGSVRSAHDVIALANGYGAFSAGEKTFVDTGVMHPFVLVLSPGK